MSRPDDVQLLAMCDEATDIIGRLRAGGREALRRARSGGGVADGYPQRSGPGAGGGGDGTSTPERLALAAWSAERLDDPDPEVAAAELAGLPGDEGAYARHAAPDPVRRAVNGMCSSFGAALVKLREADGDLDGVVGARARTVAPLGSRESTVGACWVCELPAHPIVAGMCTRCLGLWESAGRPDRSAFREERRVSLAAGRLYDRVTDAAALDATPARARPATPAPASRVCALCGHDPACKAAPVFDATLGRWLSLCEVTDHSCYARWCNGERPAA